MKIFLAEFASPEFVKRLQPKKREPHFLFEKRFDRRRNRDASFCVRAQRLFDPGNVWQIEQFEESINGATILRLVVFGRQQRASCSQGRCSRLGSGLRSEPWSTPAATAGFPEDASVF